MEANLLCGAAPGPIGIEYWLAAPPTIGWLVDAGTKAEGICPEAKEPACPDARETFPDGIRPTFGCAA